MPFLECADDDTDRAYDPHYVEFTAEEVSKMPGLCAFAPTRSGTSTNGGPIVYSWTFALICVDAETPDDSTLPAHRETAL